MEKSSADLVNRQDLRGDHSRFQAGSLPSSEDDRPILQPLVHSSSTTERPGWPTQALSGRFIFSLILAGFLVQIGALVFLRRDATLELIDGDEREYWNIATKLLDGGLPAFPVTRTLGFPLTIAAIRAVVGDHYFWVQFVVSALLVFMAPLTYRLIRTVLGSERAARLGALGVLFWPVYVRLGVTLYSDSLTLVLFLLYLNLFISAWRSTTVESFSWPRWLLTGAMLGICIHFRPMYLLYSPIAFALALWNPAGARRGLLSAAALTIGCLGVVSPWTAYISEREGHFLLLCTNDGQTFSIGLNPKIARMDGYEVGYTPGGRPFRKGPGIIAPTWDTGYITPEERASLSRIEANRLVLERTKRWVLSHPGDAAYLTIRKLLFMWGIYPFWWGIYPFWQALFTTLVGNLLVVLLLLGSAVALVRFRRHLRELSLFWTLPLFACLVGAIFLGSWRYRMPGDLGVIALTAALLAFPEVKRFLDQDPAPSHRREHPER